MGIADDARQHLNDAKDQARSNEEAKRAKEMATLNELRRVVGPLALEFAKTAKPHSGPFTRSWSFEIVYHYGTSGDGHANYSRANVTVRRNGEFNLSAPTAAYGDGVVDEGAVRGGMTAALADVMKGK